MQRAFSDVQKAAGGTTGPDRTPMTVCNLRAAWYDTRFLIELIPKRVVCSFPGR